MTQEMTFLLLILQFFPPIPLIIILLIFAIYPARYPTNKFFKIRGFENSLLEYFYIKKILIGAILPMVILVPIYIISINTSIEVLKSDQALLDVEKQLNSTVASKIKTLNLTGSATQEAMLGDNDIKRMSNELNSMLLQRVPMLKFTGIIYKILTHLLLPISISIIVKLLLEHSRKLFKLYLAKACFVIASNGFTTAIDKAKYFMIGLIWYSKFLKDTIYLKINNIDSFYESVLTKGSIDDDDTFLSLAKEFERDDEFAPLRFLSTTIPIDKGEKILTLTDQSLSNRVKESSDLIIPIVTIVVTLVTTFLIKPL